MNIVFFSDSVSSKLTYGNAVRSCSIARALSKNGHNVSFVCSHFDRRENLLEGSNVAVLYLDVRRGICSFFSEIISLCRLLASADLCVPCLFWDFSHILFYLFNLFFKSRYSLMPNGTLPPYGRSLLFKSLYMILFGDALLRRSSAVFAVTHLEARTINNAYQLQNILILPNGLSLPSSETNLHLSTVPSSHDSPDTFCITYLGRLSSEKGVDLLIRAFGDLVNKHRNSRLSLAIAGPDFGVKDDLMTLVDSINLTASSVRFLGAIDGQEKIDFYQSSSLHVVPSRHEAMSMVALEAAFYSTCPVVATFECGLHEFECLSDSFSFCEASVSSLLSVMSYLFNASCSRSYHRIMMNKCENRRKVIRESFSWNSVACKFIADYHAAVRAGIHTPL